MTIRDQIQAKSQDVIAKLLKHIAGTGKLCIIKAPPGSGKTFTLLKAVAFSYQRGDRIAVATQTNAQADDVCRRLVRDYPDVHVTRFGASGTAVPEDLDGHIGWVTATQDLPTARCLVVGTTAKWSLVGLSQSFDRLFVDEAWQMTWCDCMLLQPVASKFVLIGDPGQIPPVVTVAVNRWETSPRAPHMPAPELILRDPGITKLTLELPACRRLPADSVELVRPFYDFHFDAWAKPGERSVRLKAKRKLDSLDRALDSWDQGSNIIATLRTPEGGPPLEEDVEIASLAAQLASRILARGATAIDDDDGELRPVSPEDIGIAATHRLMNSAIQRALAQAARSRGGAIRVDTPERWQGLERKVMIVIHPLSGVVQPSAFDLETGRLCVMAFRHRAGLIVVSRDHVHDTLERHIPAAEQAVGRPDLTGRGHWQNLRFWSTLRGADRVVACD